MKIALTSLIVLIALLTLFIPDVAAEVRTGKGLSPVLDGRVFVVVLAPLNGSGAGIPGSDSRTGLAASDISGAVFQRSSERFSSFNSDRTVFTFAGGRFHLDTVRCAECADGLYRSTVIGDSISFEAESSGAAGERVIWNGTLHGSDLFGTAVRTTPEGARAEYTFYGNAGD